MPHIAVPAALPTSVCELIERYLCLNLGGTCVACPYWQNTSKSKIQNLLMPEEFLGKSLPGKIEKKAIQLADEENVDFKTMPEAAIRQFVSKRKLGIDCSGLVYHLLECFQRELFGTEIKDQLTWTPNANPLARFRAPQLRINADYWTSEHNSRPVSLEEAQAGDLIRARGGEHILLILEKTTKHIVYIHSSSPLMTKEHGVHLQKITITSPKKSLAEQKWLEQMSNGKAYNVGSYNEEVGDGIFRLKWWK